MTSDRSQANTLWSNILLAAIADLRELQQREENALADSAKEDLERLFSGADRMERLLANGEDGADRHDLMNALAAIRGYAEMLQEDIGEQLPQFDEKPFAAAEGSSHRPQRRRGSPGPE